LLAGVLNRRHDRFGLKGTGIAVTVRARRAGGTAIRAAERVWGAFDLLQDRLRLGRGRGLAVEGAVGEEELARARVAERHRFGIGDHIGDGFGDAGEMLAVEVMRARLICGA
jgi:hypothetical protein